MNEITISRFVHFTHPKISDRLRGSKFTNLNEAISLALAEESSLRLINPNFMKTTTNFNTFSKNITPKQTSSTSSYEKRYCVNCKTNTHNTDKCYVKHNTHIRQIQTFPSNVNNAQNNSQSFTKICAYCKNKGHLIPECRKRQFNAKLAEVRIHNKFVI